MTTKELISAAKQLREFLPAVHPSQYHLDVKAVAEHVLATVCEDDEELITAEWLARSMKPSELSPMVYGYSRVLPGMTIKMEPHKAHGWLAILLQDEIQIDLGPCKTRGQLRKLLEVF